VFDIFDQFINVLRVFLVTSGTVVHTTLVITGYTVITVVVVFCFLAQFLELT